MTTSSNIFNSLFSLKPLIQVLQRMVSENKPGARKLYEDLLKEVQTKPELLEPITDNEILKKDKDIVEIVLSTIFPPSTSANQGMYAVSFPFSSETVYSSPTFKDQFLQNGSTIISVSDNKTNYSIAKASLSLAYNLILKKFYSWDLSPVASSVHQ